MLAQELSLATMIFEIGVLELVRIAMLPKSDKNARRCYILVPCVPDYFNQHEITLLGTHMRHWACKREKYRKFYKAIVKRS